MSHYLCVFMIILSVIKLTALKPKTLTFEEDQPSKSAADKLYFLPILQNLVNWYYYLIDYLETKLINLLSSIPSSIA